MAGALHDPELLRSRERSEHPARVIGSRLGVHGTVDQQHGNPHPLGGRDRAHSSRIELRLAPRVVERVPDVPPRDVPGRPLARDGLQIREDSCRHHPDHARIVRRLLQRHRRTERNAHEHDPLRADRVEHPRQVAALVEAVRARVPARFPVRPPVVRDDVEAAPREALGEPDAGRAVVGDAVQVDHRDAARGRDGRERPAPERHAVALDDDVAVQQHRLADDEAPRRVQQRGRAPRWRDAGGRGDQQRRERGPTGPVAGSDVRHASEYARRP